MGNFNDPLDKDFIESQEDSLNDGLIPIDFEVVARDQSYLASAKDPDSMIESIKSITDTYKSFGEQYGIDIKFDVDSVSETFRSIISEDAEKVFTLYLSKSYSKVRLAIFNKILISVQTLVDRITQRDILESDNIEMSVGLLDKLFELMDKVNKVYKDIKIDSANLLLKNVSKELSDVKSGAGTSDLNSKEISEVLRNLRKTSVK
jgi:hypothetical protein